LKNIWVASNLIKCDSAVVHNMGGGTFFKVEAPVDVIRLQKNFCGLKWQLWRRKHWNMTSLPIHHIKV